ncbi:MAG: type II secretion system protein [Candidatus Omnitrophota bacterium]
MSRQFQNKKVLLRGLTLVETLVTTVVFSLAFLGVLFSYVTCLELSEIAKNSSQALFAVKSQIETIKNTNFDQVKTAYNNTSYAAANLVGIGVSYIDDSNPRLLFIVSTFCWRQPNGRVIGEDRNLNAQLDAGEDLNGNGRLDSLVTTVDYIYDR